MSDPRVFILQEWHDAVNDVGQERFHLFDTALSYSRNYHESSVSVTPISILKHWWKQCNNMRKNSFTSKSTCKSVKTAFSCNWVAISFNIIYIILICPIIVIFQ